jgi:demethoxyubiquinone hydroxylase (CLK1/Coq7/Cat5 family)
VALVMRAVPSRADVTDRLSSFYRGEISAVETYDQALQSGTLARHGAQLRLCRSSHQARVELLADAIRALGARPPSSSGIWGAFARAIEGTAAALGERAAILALEEGEDHGLGEYRAHAGELDVASEALVLQRLLPAQLETHRIVRELKHAVG